MFKNPYEAFSKFFKGKSESAGKVYQYKSGYMIESVGMDCPTGAPHAHLNVALKRGIFTEENFFDENKDGVKVFDNNDQIMEYLVSQAGSRDFSGGSSIMGLPTPFGALSVQEFMLPVKTRRDGKIIAIVDKALAERFDKEQKSIIQNIVLPKETNIYEALHWMDTMALALVSKHGIADYTPKLAKSYGFRTLKFEKTDIDSNFKKSYLLQKAVNTYFLSKCIKHDRPTDKITMDAAHNHLFPALTDMIGIGSPQDTGMEPLSVDNVPHHVLRIYHPLLDYEVKLFSEDPESTAALFILYKKTKGEPEKIAEGELTARSFMDKIYKPMVQDGVDKAYVTEQQIDDYIDLCMTVDSCKYDPLKILTKKVAQSPERNL